MDRPIVEYIMGVDLAQVNDFTALCILEVHRAWCGWSEMGRPISQPIAESEQLRRIVHLERFERGTSYPAMVQSIGQRLHAIPRAGRGDPDVGLAEVTLVVDATGIGRAVIDMLRDAELRPVPITITGGDVVTRDGEYWRVPKRDLVTKVKVLQERRRLQVQQELPLAPVLTQELQNFKYKISLRGHDSYGAGAAPEWREGAHDDLVLAVALACWAADESVNPRAEIAESPFVDWRG